MSAAPPVRAVLWDFGGVILASPFAAFAACERRNGLLRRIAAADPDDNAWARLERSGIGLERFCALFEAEARALSARYETARLTDNFRGAGPRPPAVAEVVRLFDAVFESRELGVRKPDPRFYALACERLGVSFAESVFLDDLGVDLKPARALGIRTIEVTDPDSALAELEAHLGHPVRSAILVMGNLAAPRRSRERRVRTALRP